jgi:hypothetical protein
LQSSVKKSQLPASQGKLKRSSKDFVTDNVKCVASTNLKYNQQKVIDSHKGKAWPATAPTFIFKKVCFVLCQQYKMILGKFLTELWNLASIQK